MINSSRSPGFALALVLAALTPHCGGSDDSIADSAGGAGSGAAAGASSGGAGSGGQAAGGAGTGGKTGSGGGAAGATAGGGQAGAGATAGGAGSSGGQAGSAGNAGQAGGGDAGQAGSAGEGQAGGGQAGGGQAGGGQAGAGQAGGGDAGTGGVSAGGQAGGGGTAGDAGQGGGGGGAPCEVIPTFAAVLAKPLSGCGGFEPPCHNVSAGSLHFKASDPDGTYAALVNVTSTIPGAGLRVAPGDAANSFLYRKLINVLTPDEGDPMPKPGGLAGATWKELPADQIELLRCWIQGGAKKD